MSNWPTCYAERYTQLLLQCRLTVPQVIQKHKVMLLRINKNKAKTGCCTTFILKLVHSVLQLAAVNSIPHVYPCFQFQIPRFIHSFISNILLSVHYKNEILCDNLMLLQIFHLLFSEIWRLTLKHKVEILYLSHSPSCTLAYTALFQLYQTFCTIFSSL